MRRYECHTVSKGVVQHYGLPAMVGVKRLVFLRLLTFGAERQQQPNTPLAINLHATTRRRAELAILVIQGCKRLP